jgi:UDP:flavonoid glycosyltransferase YjiC (YdhE family)
MVLLPMGADQPYNAARCEVLGVARTLDVISASSEDIRAAADAVLSDPSYAAAAGRWRDEFAALPGPEHAVLLLERLVETWSGSGTLSSPADSAFRTG